MAIVRKTELQKKMDALSGNIKKRQKIENVDDFLMSKFLDMNVRTYQYKVRDPEKFTVMELAQIFTKLRFSSSEILESFG